MATRKGFLWVKNARGQMSIFFATILLIIITLMAFTINIGLYVKGKINLQNAVDAAAWAGAAAQARQLSNISYLNWELRNIYKEWMFKYYVLGNLSLPNVRTAILSGVANEMNFAMSTLPGETFHDPYSIPSVCIHYAGATNICKVYKVPGLPRVDQLGGNTAIGANAITGNFIDTLVAKKGQACSDTSMLNFLIAMAWTYGSGEQNSLLAQQAPQVAVERPGAWLNALEVAMRIRNLEYIVNRKPISGGICGMEGMCESSIANLTSGNGLLNERPAKAFLSAYRNLGNKSDSEMKNTLIIKEIPPKEVIYTNQYDLSNLLIPVGKGTKNYLDLKLHLINYVLFYTSFINSAGASSYGPITDQAACDATKIGIPVPAYPLEFVKNPDVLTYYAISGEAKFLGLFNPFKQETRLRVFSAAKPFGGRIGPHLFKSADTVVTGRGQSGEAGRYRSSGYVIGLQTPGSYQNGYPVPAASNFWIKNAGDALGGWLGGGVKFAIPNLVYQSGGPSVQTAGEAIQIIKQDAGAKIGLYHGKQFTPFAKNLPGLAPSATEITAAILKARAPTGYDTKNYLIPTPTNINASSNVDSFGNGSTDANGVTTVNVFAPLVDTSYLYASNDAVGQTIKGFLNAQQSAIDTYKNQMEAVANSIRAAYPSSTNSTQLVDMANNTAKIISDPTCNSIAGKFIYFFSYGTNFPMNPGASQPNCLEPLVTALDKYLTLRQSQKLYQIQYMQTGLGSSTLFNAFQPGPLSGATDAGASQHPFKSSSPENHWRNFYSTKHIAIKAVLDSNVSTGGYGSKNFPMYSEGKKDNTSEIQLDTFKNFIDLAPYGLTISDIPY